MSASTISFVATSTGTWRSPRGARIADLRSRCWARYCLAYGTLSVWVVAGQQATLPDLGRLSGDLSQNLTTVELAGLPNASCSRQVGQDRRQAVAMSEGLAGSLVMPILAASFPEQSVTEFGSPASCRTSKTVWRMFMPPNAAFTSDYDGLTFRERLPRSAPVSADAWSSGT